MKQSSSLGKENETTDCLTALRSSCLIDIGANHSKLTKTRFKSAARDNSRTNASARIKAIQKLIYIDMEFTSCPNPI
jgi:hypothetical protein